MVKPASPGLSRFQEEIEHQNHLLASVSEIPDTLRFFIGELADEVASLPDTTAFGVDPYLVLSAQRALIGALRALDLEDEQIARRQMRLRLEQMRQVYRDLAEGGPVYEDRTPKELAQWLADVVEAPQARLASLFDVSPRTLQRWISDSDPNGPEGEDARRVRIVAAIVNHLRHALTGLGTLMWFEQPNPGLENRRPADILDELDAGGRLSALAASMRSQTSA